MNLIKEKKSKKQVSLAIVCIKVTLNNIIVNITDIQGDTLICYTGGRSGFNGTRKATPYAAQVVVKSALDWVKENHGVKTVTVKIKGPGSQRESALRTISEYQGILVTMLTDLSPIPYNGCTRRKRPRK